MFSKVGDLISNAIKTRRNTLYNYWALSKYNNKKYQALPKRLRTYKAYKYVNLGNYPFIFFMIDENNSQCLSTFLKGITYRNQVMYDQQNPLLINPIQFAYLNNSPQIIKILEQHGGQIHIRNSLGQNILHIAAINNRPGVFRDALKKDMDIDCVDQFKNTPLHYSAKQGANQMVKYLLENKARKDILNVEEKYPVHLAVESQNIETVKLLTDGMELMEYPDIHPIHLAARLPDLNILLELLKYKKEFIYKQDKKQLTVLHHAILGNNEAHLSQLVYYKPQLDKPDEVGNTALHLAVLENKIWAVRMLVEAGANLKAKNQDNLTPVDCAFHSRSQQVLRYFQTLGRKDLQNEYFNVKY